MKKMQESSFGMFLKVVAAILAGIGGVAFLVLIPVKGFGVALGTLWDFAVICAVTCAGGEVICLLQICANRLDYISRQMQEKKK